MSKCCCVFMRCSILTLTPRAWLDLILPAQCPVISDHHTNQKSRRSYLKPNWIYQTIKTNLMSELVFLEKFGPLMHFVAFTFTLRGFVNTQLAIFISQKQCTEQHEMGVPRKVFFMQMLSPNKFLLYKNIHQCVSCDILLLSIVIVIRVVPREIWTSYGGCNCAFT